MRGRHWLLYWADADHTEVVRLVLLSKHKKQLSSTGMNGVRKSIDPTINSYIQNKYVYRRITIKTAVKTSEGGEKKDLKVEAFLVRLNVFDCPSQYNLRTVCPTVQTAVWVFLRILS